MLTNLTKSNKNHANNPFYKFWYKVKGQLLWFWEASAQKKKMS